MVDLQPGKEHTAKSSHGKQYSIDMGNAPTLSHDDPSSSCGVGTSIVFSSRT